MEFIHNHYYWLEDKLSKEIYIGRCDMEWYRNMSEFDICGSDHIYSEKEFVVIGKVEIPDYIEEERLA